MKLQDFLKCKKVRCVDGDATIITTGKIYDVIGVDETFIHVTDDNGEEACYWYCRFEPVLDSAENPLQKMEPTPKLETEASETNFKVGDKVYWGLKSRIFKTHRLITANVIEVELDGRFTSVHKDELCPATQENYEKLCSLFERIDFEQPPIDLTGNDLARAMLDKGKRRIYGYGSNGLTSYEVIIDRCDKDGFYDVYGRYYDFFVPADIDTGEPLTESVLDE